MRLQLTACDLFNGAVENQAYVRCLLLSVFLGHLRNPMNVGSFKRATQRLYLTETLKRLPDL
jgi:hypothetical protein